jgi:predicted Zn-dependent protease
MARAAIAQKRGRLLDALDQYRTILIGGPEDVEVTLLAADMLLALGERQEAIALLRKNERLTSHPAVRARREALER